MVPTRKKTSKKKAAAGKTGKKVQSGKARKKAPPGKVAKNVKKAATRKKTSKKATRRQQPARRKSTNGKDASAESGQTIHCTLAATGKWSMVLPTSGIAEIIDYAPPAPLDETPEWLLGQVEWEDWQVPVISYGALIDGESPESATAQSRIMVVRSLSNTARLPFIGVLVSEIPKLASISQSEIEVTGDEGKSLGVHCKVKVGGLKGVIPDLDRLSQLVAHAAYGMSE